MNSSCSRPTIPDLGVTLRESDHTYWHQGRQLIAVGALCRELTPEFDAESMAVEYAERHGMEVEEVVKAWLDARVAGENKGHAIHDFIERYFTEESGSCPYPPAGYQECRAWVDWWTSRGAKSMEPVAFERIVAHLGLGFAGRMDMMFASSKTGRVHPFDWKSNKRFDVGNRYGRAMLRPLQDLPDCHLSRYSVQLSLYRLALEHMGVPTGDAWIVHLADKATPYRALDLRARLERWLQERKVG